CSDDRPPTRRASLPTGSAAAPRGRRPGGPTRAPGRWADVGPRRGWSGGLAGPARLRRPLRPAPPGRLATLALAAPAGTGRADRRGFHRLAVLSAPAPALGPGLPPGRPGTLHRGPQPRPAAHRGRHPLPLRPRPCPRPRPPPGPPGHAPPRPAAPP